MKKSPVAISCSIIRGGTSKGDYFLAADLPVEQSARDEVLRKVMGGPDKLQINGIGGGHPLTSKVAVVRRSSRDDADVDYLFLQVNPATGQVSDGQNCGNILAGVGPLGLAAINYVISREDRKPSLLVVSDISQERLDRAAEIFPIEWAKENGIELVYLNTADLEDPVSTLKELAGGTGYNDVFAFAPVAPVVEQGDAILAPDGCLNFFAGPSNTNFSAIMNFYNVHYGATHVVGTSGGNTDDMLESLKMMEAGLLNPSTMLTHVGGLDAVIETTLNLPNIPGGKKLVYNSVSMPLVALDDLRNHEGELYQGLAEIVEKHNGLWSPEAEKFLLANAPVI